MLKRHVKLQPTNRQGASPPQRDGSIVFARWRQCVLPHWRHLVNTIALVHPPTSPQAKRQIDRFSRFCTAHGGAYTLQWALHPPELPLPMGNLDHHVIGLHSSLGHTSHELKRQLDRFSRFRTAHYCDRQTDHATRSVTLTTRNVGQCPT